MKSRSEQTNAILDHFLKELGEPLPVVRTRRASNRVLENLAVINGDMDPVAGNHTLPRAEARHRWMPVAAVAATLFAAALLVGTLSLPSSAQPIARRLNGKLIAPGDASNIGEGKLIRTEGSEGEILALRDGSRVEMSAGVKLSIHRAGDGIQIDLAEGNVIVTAAKQHNGHLYVKTRDCLVSVVGTVFSVKAEPAGSRVAVIEGEVRVQHGDVSQTLLPGQQVATSTSMNAVPLQSEIGWSQDAVEHVAMLQQATAPVPPVAPAQVGNTPVNPDLVGEIKLILAPVDGEPIVKNKARFFSLWEQVQNNTVDAPRLGNLRIFDNGTALPNGFSFAITGIQGRTISFSNSKGETFSYGCADCSFVVSETGVARVVAASEPGVEFKLSADGNTLSATCHAAPCSLGRWITGVTWAARNGAPNAWANSVGFSISKTNPAAPQTFTITASQLTAQQGSSLLFIVTK